MISLERVDRTCLASPANSQFCLTGMLSSSPGEAALNLVGLLKDQGYWKNERKGNRLLAQLLMARVIGQVFSPKAVGALDNPLYIQAQG